LSNRPEPFSQRGLGKSPDPGETQPLAADAVRRPLSETVQNRLKRLMDLGERTFSVLLFASFAITIVENLTISPWNLLGIVNEGLVVVFIVFRRRTLDMSTRPADWLIALVGTAAPMLVRPGGHPVIPIRVGLVMMCAGILFSIWGKLILRRSFGLAAANRGVVHTGAYVFVRHPIYAGYILFYIGFFLLNPVPIAPFPIWWNGAVYSAAIALMVVRILAEERVLRKDPAYAAYMGQVRYRLAPGLF
jgi:protein-S-isoprenylcysteine O-methyltransferase Ste14